jgi:hypothetical protein
MDYRLERTARNESLFREGNERLERLQKAAAAESLDPPTNFHCECGEESCTEWVSMRLSEYEAVRSQDDRFAVVPGHETPELECIVERNAGFIIVDKVPEAEKLVADDPRGAPSH